jgi:hypothetical protein
MAKRRVRLDYDNVSDYFPPEDLEKLVGGLNVTKAGVPPHGRAVGKFMTWLNARNAEASDVEYVCTPSDAALILEHVAGVRED